MTINFQLKILFIYAVDAASENVKEGGETSSSIDGATDKLTNALKGMFRSPLFWIVVGAIILLILASYFLRRITKPERNIAKIVVRKKKVFKIIDEKSPNYFLVPFKDRLGASISLSDRIFTSDKLFINNGPDALYRINYTITFKVSDIEKFYYFNDIILEKIAVRINDCLRKFSDEGHAYDIIKDYRKQEKNIVFVINDNCEDFGIEVSSLKINFIEPCIKK